MYEIDTKRERDVDRQTGRMDKMEKTGREERDRKREIDTERERERERQRERKAERGM